MTISNPIQIGGIGSIDLSPLESRLAALETENELQANAIATLQAQGVNVEATNLTINAGTLANQAIANLSLELGRTSLLLSVATTAQSRIRLYRTASYRSADSTRSFGTVPLGEHGLLLDLIHPIGNLTWDLSPIVWVANSDNPRQSLIYAAVQNITGSAQSVELTFSYIQLEA